MSRYRPVSSVKCREGLGAVFALGILVTLLAGGCTDSGIALYSVEGRVEYPDGSPFPGGTIQIRLEEDAPFEGESPPPIARGRIEPDGTFRIYTPPEKEGAAAGAYRVTVRGLTSSIEPEVGEPIPATIPLIHPRFEKFDSSPLRIKVEPELNQPTITVQRH